MVRIHLLEKEEESSVTKGYTTMGNHGGTKES